MSNPLTLFDDLREMYLRYLDSPFDLRYPDLVAERRNLLNIDGRLFRQPLIEPIPAYQSSNNTFQGIAQSLLGLAWNAAEQSQKAAGTARLLLIVRFLAEVHDAGFTLIRVVGRVPIRI